MHYESVETSDGISIQPIHILEFDMVATIDLFCVTLLYNSTIRFQFRLNDYGGSITKQ